AATSPARALEGATGLTITRDGKQLFATGVSGNTVVQLQPGATGALSQTACIGNRAGCAGTGAGPTLNGANALAVSPDGTQVYATASNALTDVTVGPVPSLAASGGLSQRRGTAALRVACHGAGGERCVGEIALTAKRTIFTGRRHRVRKVIVVQIGNASFTLAAGRSRRVIVELNSSGRRLLGRVGRLRVQATLSQTRGFGLTVARLGVTLHRS
ncbi:MAG: hypothetical protein M3Y41_21920, partial [Pseudomonadota bacterium]|nr:hypothetical protein [Pseudomonadota bacterium]